MAFHWFLLAIAVLQCKGIRLEGEGHESNYHCDTVDGSEIRRSPVEVGSKLPICRVSYIQTVVGNGISAINRIGRASFGPPGGVPNPS